MQHASMEDYTNQLQQQAAAMAHEALLWKQKCKRAEGMLAAVAQGQSRAALARAYNAGFAAGIEEGSLFAADCLQEQLSNLGPSAQYNTGAPAPAALAPAGSIMLATPRHYTEKQTQDAATEVPAAKRACQAGMSELCLQPTTPQQCSRGASACAGPAHRPAWTPEVSVASTELPAASRVPRIHGFMLGYTNSLSRLTTDKVTAMNVLLHVAKRLDQT